MERTILSKKWNVPMPSILQNFISYLCPLHCLFVLVYYLCMCHFSYLIFARISGLI